MQFIASMHWPRYYFADQVITIRNRQDFVSMLDSESLSPRVAFVKAPTFVPADGVVNNVVETANRATIDVVAHGRAFLVMSVTPHKYWRITIDGRPAQAIITNIGFQGIIVPQGKHRVQMVYRNDLVITGLWISAIAISVFLIAVVVFR